MAAFQPGRSRVDVFDDIEDADNTDDWMARRNADIAAQADADAAGRQAWEDATRSGQDVSAAQPSDVVALGARILRQGVANEDGSSDLPLATADLGSSIQSARPIEPDGPLVSAPNLRFATARPGDSISTLLGTSDPGAVGRFLRLNGMDPGRSTIYAGASYALPTSFDDASSDEIAAGSHALQQDNERFATLRAHPAAAQADDDLWTQRFNAGLNPWTGEQVTFSTLPSGSAQPRRTWPFDPRRNAFVAGYVDGLLPGLGRAGVHAMQGLANGGILAARLSNPSLDQELSAPGQSGADDVLRAAAAAGRAIGHAVADPASVWSGAKDLAHHLNLELNPWSEPLPATEDEAYRRGKHVSENDVELVANVAAIPVGGELGATIEGMKYAADAGDVAKYLDAGWSLEKAEHLAQPYVGMSHHAVARSWRLPDFLGGGPLPDLISESPFNRLQPRGIDRGQMYDLHFRVDPSFHGAKMPRGGRGQGWSGRRLGVEKYSPLGQTWAGIPGLTKGVATGGLLDYGDDLYAWSPQEKPQ